MLHCSHERMLHVEEGFLKLLQYRLHVSDHEMQALQNSMNDTYTSHLLVTKQPVLNNQAEEVMDDVKCIREQPVQGDEYMNLLCTE